MSTSVPSSNPAASRAAAAEVSALDENSRINLLGLDRAAMEAFFEARGYKTFHGRQVLKWIHKHGVTDFDAMTDLGKKLRAELKECAEVRIPEILLEQASADGTRKWVIGLGCGNRVETVLIPDDERSTLCVSSQVGCALDCTFCSTAQQGFNRNLTAAEIVAQVWIAVREVGERLLTNVVLMGMGEPLHNYAATMTAIDIITDHHGLSIGPRYITLSTVGIPPMIRRIADEDRSFNLAVSLHAATDEERNRLVPTGRKWPLKEIVDACRYYIDKLDRRVFFEWALIAGENDNPEQAHAVGILLQNLNAHVNLIPLNR